MAVNWAELSSLLACAVPGADVNMLYDETKPESTKAIELRPRLRMFDALPALPPKWTVIIFLTQTDRVCVAIFKLDREILLQSEFDPSQTMDIVEFVKSNPILYSNWSVCQSFRNKVKLESSRLKDPCGKTIKPSGRCELLISGDETKDPSSECKFCSVKGVLDGNEEQAKVEIKEEIEVCPEVDAYPDFGELESISFEEPRAEEPQSLINRWGKHKPPLTYHALIALVLQDLPDHHGTLKDIYRKIEDNFPFYSDFENKNKWQKNIQHLLSVRHEFMRAAGSKWTFAPGVDKDALVKVKQSEDLFLQMHHKTQPTPKPKQLQPLSQDPLKSLGNPQPSEKHSSGPSLSERQKSREFDFRIKENPEKSLTGFICKFCDESFLSNKMLMSHMLSEHKDKRGFKLLSFYMDKVSLDGNEGQIMHCNRCNKVFFKVGHWVKHMQMHKGLAGIFVPDLQEYKGIYKEFSNAQSLSSYHHKHKHKLGRFICHLCGAEMVPSARHYHLRNVHKLGKEHRCEVCGYLTHDKHLLQKHMKVHNAERPFVCPHCGKTFRHKESLDICVRRCTGLGVFECSSCSKTFTCKQRLIYHERMHKGIRPHACPICHLKYTRRTNMTDHVKRVHKRNVVEILAEIKSKEDNNITGHITS